MVLSKRYQQSGCSCQEQMVCAATCSYYRHPKWTLDNTCIMLSESSSVSPVEQLSAVLAASHADRFCLTQAQLIWSWRVLRLLITIG